METTVRIAPIHYSDGSPTRLEGMETSVNGNGRDDLDRYPTRLEGMETSEANFGNPLLVTSPTRLEGMETAALPVC